MKLNKKIIYSAIAIAGITMATVALSQKHKTMNHSVEWSILVIWSIRAIWNIQVV